MTVRYPPDRILNRETLDTLWSNGWTIAPVRPHPDPYHIDPAIIPRDRAYQWVSREHDLASHKERGWREVPAERHPGVFAQWGYVGECTIGDLILVEKPKPEVEAAHAAAHAKAHQNVEDWYKGASEGGFIGSVNVWTEGDNQRQTAMRTEIEHDGVTQTELPPELVPHLKAILKERDRLVNEEHLLHLKTNTDAPNGEPFNLLACRVRCMQRAIETIRAKIGIEPPAGSRNEAVTEEPKS